MPAFCRFKQAGYSWGPVARDDLIFGGYDGRVADLGNRPSYRIEMTLACISDFYPVNSMKTYRNLWHPEAQKWPPSPPALRNPNPQLCSYENLELAFKKARRKKTTKQYVIDFESNLEENLTELKHELETFTYAPSPLTTFTVRDPKTRRISASHFRDRIVHHAICNIIAPIFEKRFIHDSFANQKGKGTHSAISRFEKFMRKVSSNGTNCGMGGGIAFWAAIPKAMC